MFKTGVLRNGEAQFVFMSVEYKPAGSDTARIAYVMTTHRQVDDLLFDGPVEWEVGPTYFDVGHMCTHGEVVNPRAGQDTRPLHVMVDYVSGPGITRCLGVVNHLPPYADVPFKLAMLSTIFGLSCSIALMLLLGTFSDHPAADTLWFLVVGLGGCLLLALSDWNYWRRDRTGAWFEAQKRAREELESLRAERRDAKHDRKLERARRRRSRRRKQAATKAARAAAAAEDLLDSLDPVKMEFATTVSTTVPVRSSGPRVTGGRSTDNTASAGAYSTGDSGSDTSDGGRA